MEDKRPQNLIRLGAAMLVIGFVLMVIPVERPLTLLDRVLMIGNEVF